MNFNLSKYCEQINKYLENTDQFTLLSNNIQGFIDKSNSNNDEVQCSTLLFCVKIDIPLLVEFAGEVAEVFLMEPIVGQHLFNLVIDFAVNVVETKLSLKIGPVLTSFQVSLPLLGPLTTYSGKFTFPGSGLFTVGGILIAYTQPSVYCKSAVFQCPMTQCAGNEKQRVHHYQQRSVSRICPLCGCTKQEYLRGRINGNEVTAIFVSHKSVQHEFFRHQGIRVILKDELINDLALGVRYIVVVSCRPPELLGWGIERTISEDVWRFENQLPVGNPKSILRLQEVIQEVRPMSQWAFTTTLSSNIATHLYPVNSFFHLKIGLLLSLASQVCSSATCLQPVSPPCNKCLCLKCNLSDGVGITKSMFHSLVSEITEYDGMPTPLLAVGPDCSSLLGATTHLARRCVNVTSSTLMGGSTAADSNWVEAGPLLLATGGVCYLGDWAKFGSGRTSSASKIITALEKGQVELQALTQSTVATPQTLPLRSAVWTYWSGDKATSSAKAQLQTLIEVFGVPFIGDESTDVGVVADRLLYEAMQSDTEPSEVLIPLNDLKKYLEITCSLKVNLTSDAKQLIRNYFVASRRERPDCLPLTAIKTMTSLAEAHARLCLRTNVIYDDVVIVIYLYEAAFTELYGPSVMSPPPLIRGGACIDPEDPIVGLQIQVTTTLDNFAIWLDQYVKSLIGENSVICSVTEE